MSFSIPGYDRSKLPYKYCEPFYSLLMIIVLLCFFTSNVMAQGQSKEGPRSKHADQLLNSKALALKANQAKQEWATPTVNSNDSKATYIAACGGGGNKPYHFKGTIDARFDKDGDGSKENVPLQGVQVRVVRKGSPLKWAQGPDAVTDESGEYNVTCTFARDRNGIVPGGKKIRFKVMARFRDDEFKIRKAGWAKNNWFKLGEDNGCNRPGGIGTSKCKDNDISEDRTFDTNNTGGKQAYMWWFYNDLQDRLEKENIGITNRPVFTHNLTITYPEKNLFKPGSSYIFNVHLEKGDWNNKRTMIHEFMHRWDIGKLGGEAHVSCFAALHHKDPDRVRSSRCTGFMEGFAEAAAAGLEKKWYGGSINLYSHSDLMSGNLGYADPDNNFKVENLSDAERSDVGWENFLEAIITNNEMGIVSGSASCDPYDVDTIKMLQVLQADRSRKADWYKALPNASFSWFTDILQEHIPNFTAQDAAIYQKLGDPSLSTSEVCSASETTTHSLVINSKDVPGATDYTISGSGDIDQISGSLAGFEVTIQADDQVNGNTATGHVKKGMDGFIVHGSVPSISLSNKNNAKIYVDGDLYTPGASQKTVSLEFGYNRGGSDYRNFKMDKPNPKQCRATCENEEKCKAFTYVPPGRQGSKARCWLKDSVPSRSKSNGLVSGVKGTDPILNVTIENGYNRGGGDYRNFKMDKPDPQICREACAKEGKCKAYTYVPPGRQGKKARCWLKDSVPKKTKDSELVSGVKEQ